MGESIFACNQKDVTLSLLWLSVMELRAGTDDMQFHRTHPSHRASRSGRRAILEY